MKSHEAVKAMLSGPDFVSVVSDVIVNHKLRNGVRKIWIDCFDGVDLRGVRFTETELFDLVYDIISEHYNVVEVFVDETGGDEPWMKVKETPA